MRKAILEYKHVWSMQGDWNLRFRPVWVLSRNKNTTRIWSVREPLTRLVHHNANSEKVKPL